MSFFITPLFIDEYNQTILDKKQQNVWFFIKNWESIRLIKGISVIIVITYSAY